MPAQTGGRVFRAVDGTVIEESLFDESLSPKLALLLRDLFPESGSAPQNGLARAGDRKILDYAAASPAAGLSGVEQSRRQRPPALRYLKRTSRLAPGVGSGMVYAVWAADGWYTFDGRPSCCIRRCASSQEGSSVPACVQ